MSGSRAHHFLPISYLNGFIDPEILRRQKRRVVWVYERGRGVRKSTPENEAHQRDFYLHESGSIEGALAEMESVVAPILADLREHPRPPTAAESGELAHYIALTFYRGPTGRQHIDQMASSVMKEISMEMAKDEANFKKTCEETAREHDLNIRADELREWVLKGEFDVQQKSPGYNLKLMLELSTELGHILEAFNIQVLVAPENQPYLACDNPVVSLQPSASARALVGMGFGLPGVEVFFPIGALTCLRLCREFPGGIRRTSPHEVRQVNKILMVCARRFTYASEKSATLEEYFDRIGCRVRYGENAFAPPWVQREVENI
jgi:hypothetical protein